MINHNLVNKIKNLISNRITVKIKNIDLIINNNLFFSRQNYISNVYFN